MGPSLRPLCFCVFLSIGEVQGLGLLFLGFCTCYLFEMLVQASGFLFLGNVGFWVSGSRV